MSRAEPPGRFSRDNLNGAFCNPLFELVIRQEFRIACVTIQSDPPVTHHEKWVVQY